MPAFIWFSRKANKTCDQIFRGNISQYMAIHDNTCRYMSIHDNTYPPILGF